MYRRLVALDRRYRLSASVARLRGRPEEAVIQDVELPVARMPEFLDLFHREVGITPVWLCPVRLRSSAAWPLYPLEPDELYVNLGFWSGVPLRPGQPDGYHNRLIEETVTALDGHKSLYSTVHYPALDRALPGRGVLAAVQRGGVQGAQASLCRGTSEENLREHYARTTAAWAANLDAHWDEAVAEVGQRTARAWRLYLTGSRLGFERNQIQLHPVLGVRPHSDGRSMMPLRPDWEPPPGEPPRT